MRDLLIFAIVVAGLTQVFARVHVGVYLWTWVSLMSPHKLAWWFATTFPFAQVIAIATFIGLITSCEPRSKLWHPETVLLAMLVVWVTCTTFIFAINPDGAFREWERFIKIQVFIFLTVLLISDRKKLDGLIWIMALSVGFYGIKGGVFTVMTAGSQRVYGPPDSFFSENNTVALALLMAVPLFRYLYLQQTNKWIRRALGSSIFLCMISIIGTQSRGALLGILAMAAFLTLKSRNKLGIAVLVIATMVGTLMLMPDKWWERMDTIQNYEEDSSAMSRLNAWTTGWNVAVDTFVGGGARIWNRQVFARYAPNPNNVFDVHSIYFEMLGEQGFPGLFLFLAIGFTFWRRCSRMVKMYKNDPEKKWAADLGAMLQVGIIGYAVSGAFLGLAYFDYPYMFVAAAVIASVVVEQPATVPASTKAGERLAVNNRTAPSVTMNRSPK